MNVFPTPAQTPSSAPTSQTAPSQHPTTRRSPYRYAVWLLWLALWGLGGCPSPPGPGDGGETLPESGAETQCTPPSPQAPQITALTYKGQVTNQPYVLRFEVSWTDPDKDLKGGSFQFVVDGTPLQRRGLPDDDPSLDEASGTIELPLLLDKSLVQGKQSVPVKLTIWDKEGNETNQPTFQLEVMP